MLRHLPVLTTALLLSAPLFAASDADRALDNLNSSDPTVQVQACRTLGAAKAEAAVPRLIELLGETSDERVAASAAAALGAIGSNDDGASAAALLKAAGAKQPALVRYAALLGLLGMDGDGHRANARTAAANAAGDDSDPLLQDLAQKLQPLFSE